MHSRFFKYWVVVFFTTLPAINNIKAQTDTTKSLLDDMPETVEKVQNSFKTTKVINLQSLEVTDAGVFDFKISHRFGNINTGAYEFYGLDQASMRIGGEYGVIPDLMAGFGRSTVEKTVDGYLKYRFMHQNSNNTRPLTILVFADAAYRAIKFNYSVSNVQRWVYTGQLIIGRKFSEGFSMQISPTIIHYNLAPIGINNDQYALGIGFRQKLTPRTSLNVEYIPVFGAKGSYHNNLAIGFDIETGGHVFNLQFSNSFGMTEPQFIARNENTWKTGGIRLGFNLSRVFTFVDPSRFKNNSY